MANRGEIAVRILGTLKKLSIKSIAIYARSDRNRPHVRAADQVHPELGMGKKGEIQSFLRGVSILRVFGWMDTQDLVWMDGLSIELIMWL